MRTGPRGGDFALPGPRAGSGPFPPLLSARTH